MKVEYINPFLEGIYNILATFGLTKVNRSNIQIKENMYINMDVTAILGLTGGVKGNISYSFSQETAKNITAMMTLKAPEETDNEMMSSAIAELSNLITGKGCKILSDRGIFTDFTTPSVIYGEDIYLVISTVQTISVDIETEVGKIQMNIGFEM